MKGCLQGGEGRRKEEEVRREGEEKGEVWKKKREGSGAGRGRRTRQEGEGGGGEKEGGRRKEGVREFGVSIYTWILIVGWRIP